MKTASKVRTAILAISLSLFHLSALGENLSAPEKPPKADSVEEVGAETSPASSATNATNAETTAANKDFKALQRYVDEITLALDASDIKKADTIARQLMTEAEKIGSPAAMATAHAARGWIDSYNHQYDSAISALKLALLELDQHGTKPTDSKYLTTLRWLVSCYTDQHKASEALSYSDKLIINDRAAKVPAAKLGTDLYKSALCNLSLRHYSIAEDEAKEAAQQLLFAAPPDDKIAKGLIYCLLVAAEAQEFLGKSDDAANTCKIALALEREYHSDKTPIAYRLQLNMSTALIGCGKFTEAQEILENILPALSAKHDSKYVTALACLAKLHAEQTQFEEAAKAFQQAVDVLSALDHSNANAQRSDKGTSAHGQSIYVNYALTLVQLGRLADAEQYFNKAIASTPSTDSSAWTAYALHELAALHRKKGDMQGAERTTERFVSTRDKMLEARLSTHLTDVRLDGKAVSPHHHWIVCKDIHLADISNKTISDITTGLANVPEPVQQRLRSAGVEIVVLSKMTDDPASDANSRPRGYPNGSNISNGSAHTSSSAAAVFIAEKWKHRNTSSWIETTDISDAIRHELGHALDDYLLDYSDTQEFVDAYNIDKKSIPQTMQKSLAYFLQHGCNGRRETFASLAANEWGASKKANELKTAFPRTRQVVKKCLSEVSKPLDTSPTSGTTIGPAQ